MLLSLKNLLLSPILLAFVYDVALGETFHKRRSSRRASPTAVEVTGLDLLQSYVCSQPTNVKRQEASNPLPSAINVPVTALPHLYMELGAYKAAAEQRMADNGIKLRKKSVWSRFSSIFRRSDTSETVHMVGLEAIQTYVCPQIVSAKRDTVLYYTTNFVFNIPIGDLQGFIDMLQSLMHQMAELMQNNGIAVPSASFAPVPVETPASMETITSTTRLTITTTVSSLPVTVTINGTPYEPLSPAGVQYSKTSSQSCPGTTTIQMTATVMVQSHVDAVSTANGGIFLQHEVTTTSAKAAKASSQAAQATAQVPKPPAVSGTPGYVFDARSAKNIAVYYGQTPATAASSLLDQCSDEDIDIVILSFIIGKEYGGKYPLINFGAACGGQTRAMMSQAPGLLQCLQLAGHISQCQSTYGKKVLISIGGATSGVSFASESEALDFGNVLWDIFGPIGNVDANLRPFGDVVLDGFDIDNENNLPAHYDTLATTLRSKYASDNSKTYYLSSAPQCPFPDASNPSALLLLCDFVFVQFYNNNGCEIGDSGFVDSVKQWSSSLAASALSPPPKLFVGAPSWSLAGPGAYANIGSPKGMRAVAEKVRALGLSNIGGLMFWDGPEGQLNVEEGQDIISWGKDGLNV